MRLRSLLPVPGDRPERFAKAAASGADGQVLPKAEGAAYVNALASYGVAGLPCRDNLGRRGPARRDREADGLYNTS